MASDTKKWRDEASARKQRNIAAPILALIVGGLVSLAIISSITTYLSVYNESINAMRQQNRAFINRIDGWIAIKGNLVEYNATLLRSLGFDQHIAMFLATIAEISEDISDVYLGFPDGTGFSIMGNPLPPEWIAYERPWYMEASQRPGQVVFTSPYMDIVLHRLAFASVRTIADYDDSLGVVALHVPFTTMMDYIAQANEMTGSFSFILDADGNILLHPNPAFVPLDELTFQNKKEVEGGRYAKMFEAIINEGFYTGYGAIYVGMPLETTGWYVITRVPISYVMSNVVPTLISIIAKASLAVISLIVTWMVLRTISATMKREHDVNEINEIFINSSPLIMNIWDDNYKLVATSQQSIEIFGLSSQEQYLERFHELSPEFQPCGTNSVEKAINFVKDAFRDGSVKFEWMHQTLNGEPLPSEITLVRFTRQGKYMVAAYTSDLRPIKAAMEKERQAKEMTQTILETSPMLIEIWNDELNIIDCNQRTLDVFGVSSKEEYIRRYLEFTPEFQPDGVTSKEKSDEYAKKVLREGSVRYEWMQITSNGEQLPLDITCARIERDGKPIIVGYSHDLRAIKEATEKEREAEERIRLLLDATPMSICLYDTNLTPIDCNEEAVRVFGLEDKSSYLNKNSLFMPAIQEDGRDSKSLLESLIRRAFVEGWARSEHLAEKEDGTIIPMDTTFVRVKYKKQYAVAEYARDITQVKAAMKKEREAEERVKLVLDASPMACFLLDSDRQALDCNQAAIELFVRQPGKYLVETYPDKINFKRCKLLDCGSCDNSGRNTCFARQHLINNHSYIFQNYEKSMGEFFSKAFINGIYRFEFPATTLYGETISCEVTIVPVKYQERNGFAFYIRDLRAEKRREIAEEESRAKSRFLARMSHEIRTPMNAVLGIAELQLQKETHPPETEEAFSRIYNSSNLLLTIINDILDMSKVESGKMEIIPVVYETANLIVDTVQLNLMHVGSKNISFGLSVDENLPTHLIGDELRIKQILNNLLSNAFKYTAEGNISLSIEVDNAPVSNDGDMVLVIRVSDTGQGMTGEDINRLFNAEFTRFNIQSNRAIQGSGLGMSIAHSFITMMQGEIKVDSVPGKGSTFTVRLPQKKKGEHILGKETAESLQKLENIQKYRKRTDKFTLDPMPYGRVLVVDDVDINLYVAEGILASYEIVVETAESGPEAIEKLKNGEVYDIIFMDHMMPEMNGIEATKIIRDMGYEHPIVALTANALKDSAEMFMNNGFSGFVSKPIDIDRLNKYLVRFIRDKHLTKGN
ncbi:MAG: ATP-binding protein [Treponema sp.]|nr:ATP-binding protein [Treponema sp.]